MLVGSNNSLTYLSPSSWWTKIFRWLSRHQERPCDIQYTFCGVRMFDFRLYVSSNNRIIAKNKSFEYPLSSFYEILDFLDKKGDASVLITFDSTKEERGKEIKFAQTCHMIDVIYESIKLYGGYRRFDKKQLYEFGWEHKNETPRMIIPSEWSVFYRFVRKWCPSFIGRFNRMYKKRYKNEDVFLMLDYVNKN